MAEEIRPNARARCFTIIAISFVIRIFYRGFIFYALVFFCFFVVILLSCASSVGRHDVAAANAACDSRKCQPPAHSTICFSFVCKCFRPAAGRRCRRCVHRSFSYRWQIHDALIIEGVCGWLREPESIVWRTGTQQFCWLLEKGMFASARLLFSFFRKMSPSFSIPPIYICGTGAQFASTRQQN